MANESIFDVAEKFDVESPFGDWLNPIEEKHNLWEARITNINVSPDFESGGLTKLIYPPGVFEPNSNVTEFESYVVVKILVTVTISNKADKVSVSINNKAKKTAVKKIGGSNEYQAKFNVQVPKSPVRADEYFKKEFLIESEVIDLYTKKITDESSVKTKIDTNGVVGEAVDYECFCNRDFDVSELKEVIIGMRKRTFDDGKSIFYYHKDNLFANESDLNEDDKSYERLTKAVNDTFKKYDINTCIRKIHFLAQAYWETRFFTKTKEAGSSLVYDPYRGRGFMQLTGVVASSKVLPGIEDSRTKNATAYLGYKKYSGLDVVEKPNLISKSIMISADSGGWFWKYGKLLEDGSILNLNTIADSDRLDRISYLVNGGVNGRKERQNAYNALKKVMDYENCVKN